MPIYDLNMCSYIHATTTDDVAILLFLHMRPVVAIFISRQLEWI